MRLNTLAAEQNHEQPDFLPIPGSNSGERLAFVSTAIENSNKKGHHRKDQNNNKNIGSDANNNSSSIGGVIFCNGFRSSMTGNKALALEAFCRSQNIPFTRFDYRGHGQSTYDESSTSGISKDDYFESMGMSEWIADANLILQTCIDSDIPRHRPQILVGSSMGAWIALHLALLHPTKVAGIIGIAAAPDFTQDIRKNLDLQQQQDLAKFQRVLLPSVYSDTPYPISQYLLEDASKWLLLDDNNSTIHINCPVRLIHGQHDVDIPWEKSLQIAKAVATDDVHVALVKSGDHRLSRPRDLDLVQRILKELIESIIQMEE